MSKPQWPAGKAQAPKRDRNEPSLTLHAPQVHTGPTQGFIVKLLKVSSRESLTHREGRAGGTRLSPRNHGSADREPGDEPPGPPQPQGQLLDLSPSMAWANQISHPICVILPLSNAIHILLRVNLIKTSDHVEGSWVETFKHLNQY